MKIHLLAVGQRMPAWVTAGYQEYAQRLPPECALHLIEIPAGKRSKDHDIARLRREEGQRLLAATPKDCYKVALDEQGTEWNTVQLAEQLKNWLAQGRGIALYLGGPDGLADECKAAADRLWSLSRLTLPHPLVRVVVAEQLYRAWSLLKNHPYHRA